MSISDFTNLIALTIALILPVAIYWLFTRITKKDRGKEQYYASVGVALMLLMAASAHFTSTSGMALMLPDWVPFRVPIVLTSGVWEIGLACAIVVKKWNYFVGLLAAATLLIFLPANIYAALNSVPFGGNALGPQYLMIRVPFQIFLIIWVLWSTKWLRLK